MTFRTHTTAALAGSALLLLLTPAPASAQAPVDYGVRFGLSFTTLSSVETIDPTVVAAAREPTMNFGGFVAVHLSGPLALHAEVLFAARGERVHDVNAPPTIGSDGVAKPPEADRVILLRYLEIPLLARASRQMGAETSLYAIGGPAFAFLRNAVIRDVADSGRFEPIDDQITGSNLSLVFGGGLQHGRWLVDARFTKGLRNVAVVPLPAPVKTGAFSVLLGIRL